jgi:hypothetical protein
MEPYSIFLAVSCMLSCTLPALYRANAKTKCTIQGGNLEHPIRPDGTSTFDRLRVSCCMSGTSPRAPQVYTSPTSGRLGD